MYRDINNQYIHLYGTTPNNYSNIANTFGIGRGLVIGWNKTAGSVMTDFVTFGEGGTGEFQFWNCNTSNTTVSSIAYLDSLGNLIINGRLTSTTGTTTTLNANQISGLQSFTSNGKSTISNAFLFVCFSIIL